MEITRPAYLKPAGCGLSGQQVCLVDCQHQPHISVSTTLLPGLLLPLLQSRSKFALIHHRHLAEASLSCGHMSLSQDAVKTYEVMQRLEQELWRAGQYTGHVIKMSAKASHGTPRVGPADLQA